jgi:hypothetical protein
LVRGRGRFAGTKVITIPAEPAPAEKLPPRLQGFGAVPPLVTDIDLSVDDRRECLDRLLIVGQRHRKSRAC